MPESDLESLRRVHDELLAQYEAHTVVIQSLAQALKHGILPDVIQDEVERVQGDRHHGKLLQRELTQYLDDEASIFRALRVRLSLSSWQDRDHLSLHQRHRFTKSFALEQLRDILIWRMQHSTSLEPGDSMDDLLELLPPTARDCHGRVPICIRASKIIRLVDSGDTRQRMIRAAETLRLHMAYTNMSNSRDSVPLLQYTLVLDVAGARLHSMDIDLLRWFMAEVYPRFPGLIGPILIYNYSWTQSSIWIVVKRILPSTVLKRILFVERAQLLRIIPSFLREDRPLPVSSTDSSITTLPLVEVPAAQSSSGASGILPRVKSLMPHSLLNPFFGYPVSSAPQMVRHPSVPGLRHGRRRKRDLIRTLAILLWRRWGALLPVTGGFGLLFFIALLLIHRRRAIGAR